MGVSLAARIMMVRPCNLIVIDSMYIIIAIDCIFSVPIYDIANSKTD